MQIQNQMQYANNLQKGFLYTFCNSKQIHFEYKEKEI